ncbi:MAG TPA: hypothetical protein VIZ68_06375, partial [Thermoplasmata archaeon]
MEKKSVLGMIVFAFVVVVLLCTPLGARASVATAGHASAPAIGSHLVSAPSHVAPAVPAQMTTYPRTVLVETFTAQWCIYCEMESQAWYSIQHQLNLNILNVGELHICYSTSNCGDGYITSDGTANTRAGYYGVAAFPTVFVDGSHSVVGAATSLSQLESWYLGLVNNASAVPGNVSIVQYATVTTDSVTSHANLTPSADGTYHAISYLVEHIGKNDSTGHDIDYVVRGSLVDKTLTLTAGVTTAIGGTKVIGPTWNVQHMSVITFLQQNSTKIVQNTNLVPVTTLTTAVAVNRSVVTAGTDSTVTVRVANSSTGANVVGAAVSLTTSNGGSLNPSSGVTGSDGTFTS